MKLPKARTDNILEQNLKNETLIYDLQTHKALNLNETLTAVYKACDGKTSFEQLRRKHKFTDDFIYLALDELKNENLLGDVSYQSPFANASRREVIKKVGLATVMVLPIITGLIAPKAAQAASGGDGGTAGRGGYDQACILDSFFPPRCNGDLRCYPTTSGEERCCEFSSAAGTRSYSGESRTQTSVSPVYMPRASAVDSDNTSCQYNLTCCDGRSATGTCTYEPDTINEYSDEDRAGFEQSGSYPYIQTCTCTCP